jgi:malonate decarboxylase epsilon subunit
VFDGMMLPVSHRNGAELFINLPPGHTLIDLAKENLSDIQVRRATPANFKTLLELTKL